MDLLKNLNLNGRDAKFNRVMRHFKNGSWSMDDVKDAVDKGWITPAQFREITGADYIRKDAEKSE